MELDTEFMNEFPGFFDNENSLRDKRCLVSSSSNKSVKHQKPIDTRKVAILRIQAWARAKLATFGEHEMYFSTGVTVRSIMDDGTRRVLRQDPQTKEFYYDGKVEKMWVIDAIDEIKARHEEHVVSKKRICFLEGELEDMDDEELWSLLKPFDKSVGVYTRKQLVKMVLHCYNTIRLGFYGDHAALSSAEKSQSLLAMQYSIMYEAAHWKGDAGFKADIENKFQV